MKVVMRTLTILLFSVLTILSGMVSATASTVDTKSPVIDGADLFSPAQEVALTDAIKRNHDQYDLFFAVETVSTLDGQSLEKVALARANELGIGDATKNNGVLIFIARDEQKVRFELGTGVSSKVSDSVVTSIIDSSVTPAFKQGDYMGGIQAGMSDVGNKYIAPPLIGDSKEGQIWFLFWAVIIVFLIAGIICFFRPAQKEKRRKAREFYDNDYQFKKAIKRLQSLEEYTRKLKYSTEKEAYTALPDEEARFNWIKETSPEVADILVKHSTAPKLNTTRPRIAVAEPTEELKDYASTLIIDRKFYDDTHGFFVSFTDKKADSAVRSFQLVGTGFKKMSIDEANTRIKKEKERYRKVREKERQRREKAETLWRSLPASKRERFEKAKSNRELTRLIAAESNEELRSFLPLISNLILSVSSGLGSSSSSGGGSSHSSRSSGSSNSSSYDSGSYGGGSFDGGGGSGSW